MYISFAKNDNLVIESSISQVPIIYKNSAVIYQIQRNNLNDCMSI